MGICNEDSWIITVWIMLDFRRLCGGGSLLACSEGESGWPTILGLWRLPLMEEVTFGVKDLNASCRIDDIQSILLINRDCAWLEKASWAKASASPNFLRSLRI